MQEKFLAIKVDVDTNRGTRIGVPNLIELFAELKIPATFLFSLGPDNTGRAIKRVFRRGFLKKVSRSSVISTYGFRTLLNGVLFPGPHIGKRNEKIIRATQLADHEVGIHCYDHIRWQDGLSKMSREEVLNEFAKAQEEFQRIFGFSALTAGAAGWQTNEFSLAAYDDAKLLYASDTRGTHPFFPRIGTTVFKTLQIPTSLPTLDELLGRPEYPFNILIDFYLRQLKIQEFPILTIHAELEGMKYITWFKNFLIQLKNENIQFIKLENIAKKLLAQPQTIPICSVVQSTIDGRSGTLAIQHI